MKKRSGKGDAAKAKVAAPMLLRSLAVSLALGQRVWQKLDACWNWLQRKQNARMANKSLRVEENVSLGMKRFVAVVKVGEQRFLLGGGGNDVALLASLDPDQGFQELLHATGAPFPSAVPQIKSRPPRTRRTEGEKCA